MPEPPLLPPEGGDVHSDLAPDNDPPLPSEQTENPTDSEQTPKTSSMEVHHHTHSPRKKWHHFLFEFLMLFLAVFFGFLAEYSLEHKIEREREREYIELVARDVSIDLSNLKYAKNANIERKKVYDSLLKDLSRLSQLPSYNSIYKNYVYTTYYDFFIETDRAVQQLKNAGGLRLITNIRASDSITAYYEMAKLVELQGQVLLKYFDQYHNEMLKLLNLYEIDSLYYSPDLILNIRSPLTIHNKDAELINRISNMLFVLRFVNDLYIGVISHLEKSGENLLTFLSKHYNLELTDASTP